MFGLVELERRVSNLVRVGTVSKVNHGSARARVKLGDIETNWLRWGTRRAGGRL